MVLSSIATLELFLCLFSTASQAHVEFLAPHFDQPVVPGQLVEIRWEITIFHGPGTIRLEYSEDGVSDYTVIVDDIPARSEEEDTFGSFLWTVPPTESSFHYLRVLYLRTLSSYDDDVRVSVSDAPSIDLVLANGLAGYAGLRDTTIYSENANANGGGQHLFAGNTGESNSRRALLAFDLAGIPQGATILAASLQLTVSKTIATAGEQSLYQLTSDWGEGVEDAPGEEGKGTTAAEGSATWESNHHAVSDWSSPGGDFVETPSATALVGGTGERGVWLSIQLVRDVQAWVDGTADNHGWILIGDENSPATAKRFHSGDDPTLPSEDRPQLFVRYQSSSETTGNPRSDINDDGQVNALDLFLLTGDWQRISK